MAIRHAGARAGWLALLLCALHAVALAQPEADAALERRVKAAFVYKFPGFVEWPELIFTRDDSPLIVAVVGDDAFAEELEQLVARRKAGGRPMAVRRVREAEAMPVPDIHILFIARSAYPRIAQLVKWAQARPVLIVTESDGALTQGSIINFVLSEGRVRFEIAFDAAEKRGLKLNSRLLAVALRVRPGAR